MVYWNSHLYYRAYRLDDGDKKIEIFNRANRIYPNNDLVYYELGRVYQNLGINNLFDKEISSEYLYKSLQNFDRSIKINPFSYFSHFHKAQALIYLRYMNLFLELNPFEEFEKAAQLAAYDSEIFYQVGKVFLSLWSELSKEQQSFTIDILKKIPPKGKRDRLLTLMQIWKMNVGDYDVIDKILPDSANYLAMYADFLGEESLSLEERKKVLAHVDQLRFSMAKNEYESGENVFYYYNFQEARNHFEYCLRLLDSLRYYQTLTQQKLIDPSEVKDLKKATYLTLVKCLLEEGQELKEFEEYLYSYLNLEDRIKEIKELESYLVERGIIDKKIGLNLNDMNRLALQLLFYYKQNRYQAIVQIGRSIQSSVVVVPEEKKEEYVQVLQIIGDAYQKINYLYDAGEFYQKALTVMPENLETLIRIRKNLLRLNEENKVGVLDKQIKKILSPEEIVSRYTIMKGRTLNRELVLNGRDIILNIEIGDIKKEFRPLVSLVFNGRIILEEYVMEESMLIPLKTQVGRNLLRIKAINQDLNIRNISKYFP
jgi:hypothetical protein